MHALSVEDKKSKPIFGSIFAKQTIKCRNLQLPASWHPRKKQFTFFDAQDKTS